MAYQNPCPPGQCVSTVGHCQSVTSINFEPHPDYECKQMAINQANNGMGMGLSGIKRKIGKAYGLGKTKKKGRKYFDTSGASTARIKTPDAVKNIFKISLLSSSLLLLLYFVSKKVLSSKKI